MKWDPSAYLKYGNERLRPALDLLARIPLDHAEYITDLGCGPGNLEPYIQSRFAGAHLIGVDRSSAMLDVARNTSSTTSNSVDWVQSDVDEWQPEDPQDLIFSNAALHWLDDHETLFPRLMDNLSPGGVLAVQMPNQFSQASHTCMRDVAQNGPWAECLKPLLRTAPVAAAKSYYDWLSPHAKTLDIWQTEYIHALDGPDPVLKWISSTALKHLSDALNPDLRQEFIATVGDKLRNAYPPQSNGITLFPFKRLFIIAVNR